MPCRCSKGSFILYLTVVVIALANVCGYEYNKVNYVEYPSLAECIKANFDGDGHALNNILLGIANPGCLEHLNFAAFKGAQRLSSGDALMVASAPLTDASAFPLPHLDACAEAFFYRMRDPLSAPTDRTTDFDREEFSSWARDAIRVHVNITNAFAHQVSLYWHEESRENPMYQLTLQPGEHTEIGTILGHVFAVRKGVPDEDHRSQSEEDEEEGAAGTGEEPKGELVDYFISRENEYVLSPHNRIETCALEPMENRFVPVEYGCSDLELRFVEFCNQVWYQSRLGLNYAQPKFVESITPVGFELRKLPVQTYEWLRKWYDDERLRAEVIESSAGPCMNQKVAPSSITHLTPALKTRLAGELKPILEDWFGRGELELTSIYGIRKYTNGSVLRMHVDTANTHVISAIINVDQKVEQDWKLLILDHQDTEHNIVMKPGDMVLYESAKNLHGRPVPFVGDHYDNIFIHFMPVSGWNYDWM